MGRLYKLICIALALSACTSSRVSFEDLDFMREQIIENHPGMYNHEDPLFKDELEKAYVKARSNIANNSGSNQKKLILSTFAKTFNDAHLWVSWKDAEKNTPRKLQNQKFAIKHISPKIVWITLPTFDIQVDQKKDFEHILQQLLNLKNKDAIVFDLLGNQGGNSEYSDQIVDYLFDESYASQQRRIANRNVSVDWRASPGNLIHMREMYARYKSDWMRHVADCIEDSITKHEPYYHAASSEIVYPTKIVRAHSVKAKIFVIIQPLNVSAALDFIDSLKMMEHSITLIGKTTKADRLYMEVRTVDLPSGMGTFSYPIKVFRNRPRGDNVPYVPDFECDAADDNELLKYVESLT